MVSSIVLLLTVIGYDKLFIWLSYTEFHYTNTWISLYQLWTIAIVTFIYVPTFGAEVLPYIKNVNLNCFLKHTYFKFKLSTTFCIENFTGVGWGELNGHSMSGSSFSNPCKKMKKCDIQNLSIYYSWWEVNWQKMFFYRGPKRSSVLVFKEAH